ncbi:hypothetical protein, partial [Streptococcus suis]|uniref:hypothetical protein n=1 Tax=Streptococcus suis TaxID=1307 RepID=UPI001EE72E9D
FLQHTILIPVTNGRYFVMNDHFFKVTESYPRYSVPDYRLTDVKQIATLLLYILEFGVEDNDRIG